MNSASFIDCLFVSFCCVQIFKSAIAPRKKNGREKGRREKGDKGEEKGKKEKESNEETHTK